MLFCRFRKTSDAYPVNDSINHAIIRSYIQRGKTDLLLPLLRDKVSHVCLIFICLSISAHGDFVNHKYFHSLSVILNIFSKVRKHFVTLYQVLNKVSSKIHFNVCLHGNKDV